MSGRSENKTCCHLFWEAIHNESQEGMGILVANDHDNKNCFALHFRAIRPSIQDVVVARIGILDQRIMLEVTQFINFCPWCGIDLKKFYKNHEFENKAKGTSLNLQGE